MDLNLKGKVVFISGSSKGIGFHIANKFLYEGAKVAINGRTKSTLYKSFSILNKTYGKNVISILGDVSKPEESKIIIKKLISEFKRLDILICNAGSGKSVAAGKENYSEWNKVFSNNFFSATNIIEASIKELSKSRGKILCISSICGIEHIPGAPVSYSVAKAALNSYVKNISKVLAKSGIIINAIAPGNVLFKGSVWEKKIKNNPLAVKNMIQDNVPLSRFLLPSEIANFILWLSSDYSSFSTGNIFRIDGGQLRS